MSLVWKQTGPTSLEESPSYAAATMSRSAVADERSTRVSEDLQAIRTNLLRIREIFMTKWPQASSGRARRRSDYEDFSYIKGPRLPQAAKQDFHLSPKLVLVSRRIRF